MLSWRPRHTKILRGRSASGRPRFVSVTVTGLAPCPAGPEPPSVREEVKTQEGLSQPERPLQGRGQRSRWCQGADGRVRLASALHIACPALVTAWAWLAFPRLFSILQPRPVWGSSWPPAHSPSPPQSSPALAGAMGSLATGQTGHKHGPAPVSVHPDLAVWSQACTEPPDHF